MRPVSVLIKPAGGLCNMRCRYCFYADETAKREKENCDVMSFETLRGVLKNVHQYARGYCYIAFQDGEPTLAGLDFFREAVRLADELNVNKCRIGWSIQTNGLLLDETWLAFLAGRDPL